MKGGSQDASYTRTLRLIPAENGTGETVPAFGLVELEGRGSKGFTIVKPRTNGCFVYVNGPVAILDGQSGEVTSSPGGVVIAANGTPVAGETWGAKAASFLAEKDNSGFLILQGVSGKAFADRPGGTTGASGLELIHITSRTEASGYWTGYVYIDDGAGGLTEGAAVRAILTPAGGETFEVGDYWMRRSGTVTVSEVEYPVYYAPGNDYWFHTRCIDSVERCYRLSLPHPIAEVEVDCDTLEPIGGEGGEELFFFF